MIDVDAIDGQFVPRAQPDVAMVLVGREIVLGRVGEGTTYLQTAALNESGSIVWQCFDGSGTIDDIAVDVADVFGVDVGAVRADIEALAREVGAAGFLVGVREAVTEIGAEPEGIAVGTPFPDFEAHDEQGKSFTAHDLRDHRSLVVSWSPTCTWCDLVAGDLAELVPSLHDAGVDVVLLAVGAASANRELLERHGLRARLLLQTEAIAEAFVGLGTPVAYLVDAAGVVAETIALGATEVMDLARFAAGPPPAA